MYIYVCRNSHIGQVRKNRHANGDQGGGGGGAGGRSSHRATASSSQLTVDMTEQYLDSNGRVEITCLATIPEHVNQGEQYADYKTFSMRGKCNLNHIIFRTEFIVSILLLLIAKCINFGIVVYFAANIALRSNCGRDDAHAVYSRRYTWKIKWTQGEVGVVDLHAI